MADNIKANPTDFFFDGQKAVYWLESINKPSDGVGLMAYGAKCQTLMKMPKRTFNNYMEGKW